MWHDKTLHYYAGVYMLEPGAGKGRMGLSRKRVDIDRSYHYASAARKSNSETDGVHVKLFDEQILQEQLWERKVDAQFIKGAAH